MKVVTKTKLESQMPDEAINISKEQHVRYITQQGFSMKLKVTHLLKEVGYLNSTKEKNKIEEYIQ